MTVQFPCQPPQLMVSPERGPQRVSIHLAVHVAQRVRLSFAVDEHACGVHDVADVDAGILVEDAPEEAGQVEEQGLDEQHDWHPLVVVDHLLWSFLGDVLAERQVVRVGHPADLVGVIFIVVGEVTGDPTVDLLAYVLRCANLKRSGNIILYSTSVFHNMVTSSFYTPREQI